MLDVARHFIPLKTLRETVDRMSLLKLNVLHLHLSDDQGFRFGSKKYPEVVSEDFYSLQELRSLVTYCMDRGVRLIPEIDLPGHVTHIVASRPDLAPTGRATDRTQKFGVHRACLDPSNENVFIFVRELIGSCRMYFLIPSFISEEMKWTPLGGPATQTSIAL